MNVKRGKPGFLHPGHPGVVILTFLVRDPISRSGRFKGRWMGIWLHPQRDTFFDTFFDPFLLPWAFLRGFWSIRQKVSKMGAKNDDFSTIFDPFLTRF